MYNYNMNYWLEIIACEEAGTKFLNKRKYGSTDEAHRALMAHLDSKGYIHIVLDMRCQFAIIIRADKTLELKITRTA